MLLHLRGFDNDNAFFTHKAFEVANYRLHEAKMRSPFRPSIDVLREDAYLDNSRRNKEAQSSSSEKKKTELCKTFLMGSTCPYGDKCSFAHGKEELRTKSNVSQKYKTKNCRMYYEQGYCRFGPRCQFKHHDEARSILFPRYSCELLMKTFENVFNEHDGYENIEGLITQHLGLLETTGRKLPFLETLHLN